MLIIFPPVLVLIIVCLILLTYALRFPNWGTLHALLATLE